jgi:ABC-type transport system involved in multi-copper enzyme maturation permease subunit
VLTLVVREIRDNIVSVVGPCLIGAIIVTILICASFWEMQGGVFIFPSVLLGVMLLGFCSLGAVQMYGDRANRISSLLSTLAVTRGQIFTARVLVGVLTILASLAPGIIMAIVLLWAFGTPLEFFYRMIVEIILAITLTGLACYCVGLMVGWTANKAWLAAGSLSLFALMATLIWIKGFGVEAMLILLLSIVAMLLRTWQRFTSASL